MLYLLQATDHSYALVSDSEQADGWYDNIFDLDTNLKFKYCKAKGKTLPETFVIYKHTIIATFSHISEFHNLPQTHPELFL